jgi:hypothetical protein
MKEIGNFEILDVNGREELSVCQYIGSLLDLLAENETFLKIRKLIDDHNQAPSRSDIPKVDYYLINQILEILMPTRELIVLSKGSLIWPTIPNAYPPHKIGLFEFIVDKNGVGELYARICIGAVEDLLEYNKQLLYMRKLIEGYNDSPYRTDIPSVDPRFVDEFIEMMMPTRELFEASKGCLSWPVLPNTDTMKKAS